MSLITFKAIANFTTDLGDVFSEKHRPLKLYTHLINKTTIAHDKAIQKHIEAFRSFCVANRDAISSKKSDSFVKKKISYSKRVFINMIEIFNYSDQETSTVIWNHLLTISALVDPSGEAKKILKNQASKSGGGGEMDFLSDIFSKVGQNIDSKSSSNPMEAISSIMKSGIVQDIFSGMGNGMQDGSLDLGKLMGTVSSMMSNMNIATDCQKGGDAEQSMPDLAKMFGAMMGGDGQTSDGNESNSSLDFNKMFGSMMGGLGIDPKNSNNTSQSMPDIAGLMGGVLGIPNLADMTVDNQSIGDKINEQLQAAKDFEQLD